MTAQQEKKIFQLESLLAETKTFLENIITASFIYGEKFYECMYCGSGSPDEHFEDCLVLKAETVYRHVDIATQHHAIEKGG